MIHIKERLKQYADKYSDCYKYAGVYVKVIQDMIEQLKDDLEQDEKENGWIPVSERLPEIKMDYKECYLVTDGRFCWMAYYVSEKEWILADCTDCKNKIDWTGIVAWRPLPEPYKED
nr:MAG TPA: Protein of unknown function (DUF551) [Caudoviricetes sp.]